MRRVIEVGDLGDSSFWEANGESYEGQKRSDQEVRRKTGED